MSTVGEGQAPGVQAVADPYRYGWRYVVRTDERGQRSRVRVPLTQQDVLHPQEGDVVVQTAAHDRDCTYLREVLTARVADRPGMLALRDCRVDWGVEGIEPHSPDLVVFMGLTREWDPRRGTFPVREMGAAPQFVIEVTSPSTRYNDLDDKVVEYHKAGIPSYVIVDHRDDCKPPLVELLAYRSTPAGYVRAPLSPEGRLWLDAVATWLGVEKDRVVCYDERGNRVPDYVDVLKTAEHATARAEESAVLAEESIRARQEAERARQEAEAKAADLATRLQQMEAELRKFRGQP